MNIEPPITILLVDDQPAKLLTYEAILERLGETLIKATSAQEALAYLLKHEVAVIVADVVMPDLDGYELASMIREHPRFRTTSIIFVSAVLLTDFDRLRGYECGAVDYMPVPIVPEILRAKVSVFADLYRKSRQLEQLNRDLEDRVTECTAALEASTAALRDADRRKDEFLAILAHELRNPLAPIRTAVHLMRLETVSDHQREKARQIIECQVDHLVRLVDDLLDISRFSRDTITLSCEDVDLRAVVARSIEANGPLIDAQAIEVLVEDGDQPVHVHGDEVRLVQAVGNVVNNAAKFSSAGGCVRVSVDRDGREAVICVRDDGIGIPHDMQARIFDLFVQAGATQGGGLGIGLALVRRLVEMHHGRVQAFSDGPGTGTELSIRLPLLETRKATGTRADQAAASDSTAPKRILVVDDNRDAADTSAMALAAAGHEVRVAYDGECALEVVRSFIPDAVLLDIGMPGLDGCDVARRLREEPWGRQLLLIAVTGWAQPQDRLRTAEAGFDLHMVKPVSDQEIAAALAALEDRAIR